MQHISLSAKDIVKRYGGVIALSDGSLEVNSGQVVALVGANGSGKSTLSKVITGVVAPNGGAVHVDGQLVSFASPEPAKALGITAVYQELSLIPDMTVAENVWLTQEPSAMRLWVRRQEMEVRTAELLALFDGAARPSLRPDSIVKMLPPAERQIVEILKALSLRPRLIILDEATASLDSKQVNRLFELVQDWKRAGMAIVFVSHRMEEIFRVADRVTVLRNGKTVAALDVASTTRDEIVSLMIEAATAHGFRERTPLRPGAPLRLEVKNLQTQTGRLNGVSLDLHDGELLGLGGLQGQGQSDLLMALFGAEPYQGEIVLSGKPVRFGHPRRAIEQGVALVPGDRGAQGLLLIRSILENLHLPSWGRYGVPLNMARARQDGQRIANELRLVMESLDAPVSSLSGGNAQKVVLGKWLLREPKVLLLNDPTKGVDVGAKAEFYNMLQTLREAGAAILFYSTDDDELLHLCDRVLVLHDGRIEAELSGESLTRTNLIAASMGATSAPAVSLDTTSAVS